LIELKKKTMNDVVGEPSKFKAVFKGYYHDKPVTLTFEAETERDLSYVVPLIPGQKLELEINNPQTALDKFFTDEKALEAISAAAQKLIEEDDKQQEERKKQYKDRDGGGAQA
jgi:hypothetical protein